MRRNNYRYSFFASAVAYASYIKCCFTSSCGSCAQIDCGIRCLDEMSVVLIWVFLSLRVDSTLLLIDIVVLLLPWLMHPICSVASHLPVVLVIKLRLICGVRCLDEISVVLIWLSLSLHVDSKLLHIFSKFGGLRLTEKSSFHSHQGLTVYFSGCSWGKPTRGLVAESATSSMFMVGT